MSQAAILALFTTLSQQERVETVQSLVALLGGAAPAVPAKKATKASESALAGLVRATQRSEKVSAAPAPAKEKVSRGASAWTQYVMRVRAETGLKMAEAMAEAKRRREAGDPDAPPAKKPTAAAKPKTTPAAAPAAPPAPEPEAEEESEGLELEEAEISGIDYLYLPSHENAAWLKEADGSRGAWAGYLDTETGELDTSRPAPEFEEADE